MSHPSDINRPLGVDRMAREIDSETELKKTFKGIAGGKPASKSVLLGRHIRRHARKGTK